ncbi:MAG: type IV pilus assembly protein PilM [Candidatus Levyibacteriota bacterium]|nr:MAG: type IV pilus assembly protein PilM [Candidatus Levybacteria bacterium]
MKTKPFGLDIGPILTRAIWLAEDKEKFNVAAIAQMPTSSKGMLSDSPFDQEAMAQSIKQMLMQGKITTPYVNIALPDSQVYTRVIDLPILSDQELSSAIYWEAEQYIPLPLKNVTLDWTVLQKPQKPIQGQKMQVLLVGTPTMLLDRYQKILDLAGLSINVVETEILSTIRPLIRNQVPSILVVYIGDLSTSFAIIKNGVIVFSYTIATGSIAITRAIAGDLGLNIAQAQEYKKVHGILQQGQNVKIGKATEPILMSIINEVKKAMEFYSQKYQSELPIQQIILSGGSARLPGIDLFFAQNCSIETVVANPFKELGIDVSLLPKEIADDAANFTVVCGLAMREYE